MLSEVTLRRFEHELSELRKKLLASIAGEFADQRIVELSPARFAHQAQPDASTAQPKPEISRAQIRLELRRVDAALNRIQSRRFGMCCRCHEAVDRKWITADPAAPFCEDCSGELSEQRRIANR